MRPRPPAHHSRGRTFSFFLLLMTRSRPLKAPEATNRMLVVSTWTDSPRSFRGEFFSGTFTTVPSSICGAGAGRAAVRVGGEGSMPHDRGRHMVGPGGREVAPGTAGVMRQSTTLAGSRPAWRRSGVSQNGPQAIG